jgi:hypothetical protein
MRFLLSGKLLVKDALLVSVLCLVNEEGLLILSVSCATPVKCICRQADCLWRGVAFPLWVVFISLQLLTRTYEVVVLIDTWVN